MSETHAEFHKRITGEPLTGDLAQDERKCYDALLNAANESIVRAKTLCSEAYKAGDAETVWMMKASIAQMERDRDRMRKPATTQPKDKNE